MNWADWIIVAIIALSSLISLKRGFIREALSLAIWGAALIISMLFQDSLAYLLEDHIELASLRRIVAVGILFASTLILGSLISYLCAELIRMTGLTGTDRMLGMIFGFLRGSIIVVLLVMFLPPLLHVDKDPWWQQSLLIPHFAMLEGWVTETGRYLQEYFVKLLN